MKRRLRGACRDAAARENASNSRKIRYFLPGAPDPPARTPLWTYPPVGAGGGVAHQRRLEVVAERRPAVRALTQGQVDAAVVDAEGEQLLRVAGLRVAEERRDVGHLRGREGGREARGA